MICHGSIHSINNDKGSHRQSNFSKEAGNAQKNHCRFTRRFNSKLTWPRSSAGAEKVARIGDLRHGFSPLPSSLLHRYDEAFYQGLREVGYTEGKNLIVEHRYSEWNSKRLPELATEFVSSKIDLIVATSTPAIEAAKRTTTKLPIVMLSVGDPVSEGVIDSLPRPGGNITGVTGVVRR